jgi:hypothetical protein
MDKSIKNSIEDNKKGLVRPFLNPTSNIAIAKLNGYFDENKNYYKHCGTEICWVFNEGVGWTKES